MNVKTAWGSPFLVSTGRAGGFFGLSFIENIYESDFGSLWDHFGIIVQSLWVYEAWFSKNIHFPTDCNDFIKIWGELCITLASFWDQFGG